MPMQIKLTRGKIALVSDHRYNELSKWKWQAVCMRGKWYAQRGDGKWPNQKMVLMHRQIMNVTDPEIEIDHWDGDGLNNQDENLRKCTHANNMQNRAPNKSSISGYKGVTWNRANNKYLAQIKVDKRNIYLGYFTNPIDAAKAYDKAACHYFGKFAYQNFKEE